MLRVRHYPRLTVHLQSRDGLQLELIRLVILSTPKSPETASQGIRPVCALLSMWVYTHCSYSGRHCKNFPDPNLKESFLKIFPLFFSQKSIIIL
jgi:hypothetical protein